MPGYEQTEYALLRLANPEGVFAIEARSILARAKQSALERLRLRHWIALVGSSAISRNPNGRLLRIFLASEIAMEWFRMQG
jgi:hypothetical protein